MTRICYNDKNKKKIIQLLHHVRIQRGGTGGPDPPEQSKKIGFLSNVGPDPLKIAKQPGQHSMLAFRWLADDGPILVVFRSTN